MKLTAEMPHLYTLVLTLKDIRIIHSGTICATNTVFMKITGIVPKVQDWYLQGKVEYTPTELEAHDHGYKLPKSDKVALRVNYRQMGVGGDDSWMSKTHPEFTLYANRSYAYCFTIKGISEF